jgi:selenocysteine-specific elongation factor
LTGGQIRRGQNVVVQPQDFEARIRSIQSHRSELECAQPGMRTAINLPDVAIGDGPAQIKRGDVITAVDLGKSSGSLIAILEKSSRPGRKDVAARPLKNGSSAYLHHGTSRLPAKINLLEERALEPGKRTIAQVKLASPIFAFLGDRFVLRDASEQHTIAGGVVLDSDGDRGKCRTATQRKLLATRAGALENVYLCVRSEVLVNAFVREQAVLRKSHFSAEEITEALQRLQRRGEIVIYQEIAADAQAWQTLRGRAMALIDDGHKRNPERAGLDLNELRAALRNQPPDIFEAIISDLCAGDFVRKGSAIARISHRPVLPPNLQPVAMKIREALSAKPFDPPSRKDFSEDGHLQQALRFLIEQGKIVELNSEIVLLRDAAEQMRTAVAEFLSKHGPAPASQLRQKIGTSRRVIIPFLEYLDRVGVTQRIGDSRQLRRTKSAAVARR